MPVLSEAKIRASKPMERPYKLFDERGLFMLVTPSGGRLWRFRYRHGGVEKLLTLGAYPDVSLKRAREKRDEARSHVADGVDPNVKRQAERAAQADTFEAIAREWLELQSKSLAAETMEILGTRLKSFLYPYIGGRPIRAITAQELLAALRRIEARGKHETAHRVRSLAGRVFRYAVATGRAERDVAADLKDALAPVKSRNFASVTDPARVGELLRAIDGYDGQPVTALALKLAPLVFVRPGELRAAEWSEFDLENAEWRIPGARMKMGEQHIVPLSRQSVLVKSAFERLLRIGSNAKDFSNALQACIPNMDADLQGPLLESWKRRFPQASSILGAWAQEFSALRGANAHGMDRKLDHFVWSSAAHLAFASILFPLIVKKKLADAGLWVQPEEDTEKLRRIQDYLMHDPFNVGKTNRENSHPWSDIDGEVLMAGYERRMREGLRQVISKAVDSTGGTDP